MSVVIINKRVDVRVSAFFEPVPDDKRDDVAH
jgi:hypothetical protein